MYRPNENNKWPMQPDIDIELETFETMEYEGNPDWEPIFDPKAFCENRPELLLADYRLS